MVLDQNDYTVLEAFGGGMSWRLGFSERPKRDEAEQQCACDHAYQGRILTL